MSKRRRGKITPCGTFRYCAGCGKTEVAKGHADQRCWACQQKAAK